MKTLMPADFINTILIFLYALQSVIAQPNEVYTVTGKLSANDMGLTLSHEHLLVDFIGADSIDKSSWQIDSVVEVMLPYLLEIKEIGANTFIDCTPAYLGRDPSLLKKLSELSGINIITNTGYYGAVGNKYLPPHAFSESSHELAERWLNEWQNGIEGSGVLPGFMKIGVESGPLSPLHQKLIRAAAFAHLQSGMTIASHTGDGIAAMEQIEILKESGVHPSAFGWVHAQNEKDLSLHLKAARQGSWISLDGVHPDNVELILNMIKHLKDNQLLHKLLLSQDAGWYHPREEEGGEIRGYTFLLTDFIPALNQILSKQEITMIMEENPAKAFGLHIRKL